MLVTALTQGGSPTSTSDMQGGYSFFFFEGRLLIFPLEMTM